jgi:hypothetical protein
MYRVLLWAVFYPLKGRLHTYLVRLKRIKMEWEHEKEKCE